RALRPARAPGRGPHPDLYDPGVFPVALRVPVPVGINTRVALELLLQPGPSGRGGPVGPDAGSRRSLAPSAKGVRYRVAARSRVAAGRRAGAGRSRVGPRPPVGSPPNCAGAD